MRKSAERADVNVKGPAATKVKVGPAGVAKVTATSGLLDGINASQIGNSMAELRRPYAPPIVPELEVESPSAEGEPKIDRMTLWRPRRTRSAARLLRKRCKR